MYLQKSFLLLFGLAFLSSCASIQSDFRATQIFDDDTYASSSKLSVRWESIEGATSYIIRYHESSDGSRETEQEISVVAQETSKIVLNLKSGTTYTFDGDACLDSACSSSQSLGTTTASTEEEYWQVRGTGNSHETATTIVELGSVLSYALVSPSTDGDEKIVLYFKPRGSPQDNGNSKMISIATLSSGESAVEGEEFEIQEAYGLENPCLGDSRTATETQTTSCGIDIISEIQASQAIPLASGIVRIFFEAEGQDGHTRIMSIDSADGLAGLDFNTGEDTTCGDADYRTYCVLTIRVGVVGDTTLGDSGLTDARQFKVGYPKEESWIWDETEGTFMVITGTDSCGTSENGLFYAVFDGHEWIVTKDDDGCAFPLVQSGHGPVVVDTSTSTYKLYYEDESLFRSDRSVAKPLKLIYGNTHATGDAEVMEITDWETEERAHDVHFLWPDGSIVSDANEAGFGDHYIYFPTHDPNVQIMYLNLGGLDDSTWGQPSVGLGMGQLVNP